MSKKNYHVVPKGDNWGVKGAGNERYTRVVTTQKEAKEIAREYAKNQNSELFIHRQNGQIRERSSYGNDPFPPIG